MKHFRIAVNGTSYDVEVTELDGAVSAAAAPVSTPAAPAPAPAAAPAAPAPAPAAAPAAPAPAPKAAVPAGDGTQVTAPMNGTIARVNCKVGDTVQPDTAVIILEAMKMENEIFAGVAGTVKAIQVNTGDAVQPGDVLVVIG